MDFTPKGQYTTMTERVANVNQYQYADQVHHHDAALTKERFQPVYRKEY